MVSINFKVIFKFFTNVSFDALSSVLMHVYKSIHSSLSLDCYLEYYQLACPIYSVFLFEFCKFEAC